MPNFRCSEGKRKHQIWIVASDLSRFWLRSDAMIEIWCFLLKISQFWHWTQWICEMTSICDKIPQMQSSPLRMQLGMLHHNICRSVDLRISSEQKKLENPYSLVLVIHAQTNLTEVEHTGDISREDTNESSSYWCSNCINKILCRTETVLYSMSAIIAPIK
jgi:hypothetical protein